VTTLLVLGEADVAACVDAASAVEAVEQAFVDLETGRARMPSKVYLEFPEFAGDLRVMPSAVGETYAGVKLVNSHERNPAIGLPTVIGTYVLYSQETGMPLCLMGATRLTALRTGAASAVACRYLARPDSRVLGLVGAGVQAGFQLDAIVGVLDIGSVRVWTPETDAARRDDFISRMSSRYPSIVFEVASSVEQGSAADVICTLTPSRAPLVASSMVSDGTHINAVGADGPGKQELDPQILQRARVVIDEWHQAVAGGEVNVPLLSGAIARADIAGTLSEVVTGKIPGRTSPSEVTVFDSTGLAIQDIAIAILVYERALETGAGSTIDL
jgi:alanine dehydrogenase